MIHRGLRDMVRKSHGQDAWDEIKMSVGIGPEHLISANCYGDELTLGMLTAAASRMGQSPDECLRNFGRHWLEFAQNGPYGAMLDFIGRDLSEFLRNLDDMHQALTDVMPAAEMPSFHVVEENSDRLLVSYSSKRSGLEPFVIGLLEGVLHRFGRQGSVRLISNESGKSIFEVETG
ncbi:heme NO-binding domain-containing protein [Novosphingobium sp. MW5]|nr:heme NO-binding domain-containing protein [Novosphingobium sp. MW5]